MSRVDELNRVLQSLRAASPEVEATALISDDGLMIASALPDRLDGTHVAGITATLLNLGARAAAELERGDVEEVLLRGTSGCAIIHAAGSGVLLLCLADKAVTLGLLLLEIRRAIADIQRILQDH